MTTFELRLKLPDQFAREAQAAGLLTPESISTLLKDAMRRRAAKELRLMADRIEAAGIPEMPMDEIVADIKAYRLANKKSNKRK